MILTDKCPGCGSVLLFDPDRQELCCGHCGTTAKPDDHSVLLEKEETGSGEGNERSCVSCGGNLDIQDDDSISVLCPYCGSPNILKERLDGAYRPDRVLPFQISRKKAGEILRQRVKANKFGPGRRVVETSVEQMKGAYIPYWLFNFHAEPSARYTATRVETYSDEDYIYTITDFFDVYRRMEMDYEMIPADALREMDDKVSYDLEPFDYEALKPEEASYLMGFFAKKYNVEREQGEQTARGKLRRFAEEELLQTVLGYASVTKVSGQENARVTSGKYGLLPVWVARIRFQKKEIPIFINGQTGKVIGELPRSAQKIGGFFALASVMGYLLMTLAGRLM